MPRVARVISETGQYHIVVRSIKEIELFKDREDKTRYLEILKKNKIKYGFTLYAYCLMDNHGHFIIDCLGADISRVMRSVNLSYAQYYNKKYKRYGPVFQDRFKGIPINNERYMITVSAYIHNNPKDIPGYEKKVQLYPFSSLSEYINETNRFGVLTRSFLVELVGFKHKQNKETYLRLIKNCIDPEIEIEIEFKKVESEYRSGKVCVPRDYSPSAVMAYVSKKLKQHPNDVYVKYRREYTKVRAVACLLMSNFCNMSHREICEIIGNITQSGIGYLISKGLDIVLKERDLVGDFIAQ